MNIFKYFHLRPEYECFGWRTGFFLSLAKSQYDHKKEMWVTKKWWNADVEQINLLIAIKGKSKKPFEVDHGDKVVDAYPWYWVRIGLGSGRLWKERIIWYGIMPFNENVGYHHNNGY